MTPEQFAAIKIRCRRAWNRTERGTRPRCAFEDFHQAVIVFLLTEERDRAPDEPQPESFDAHVWYACRTVLRTIVRAEIKDRETIAVIAFDSQRPLIHDVLPASFEVPSTRWGGARPNSGGKRPGAGRKPKLRVA